MAVNDYIDAKEVARMLGVSVTAVHRLAYRGTLSSSWLSGRRVWSREAIKAYLRDPEAQSRRRPSGSQPLLFQGENEVPLDRAVSELMAQAPAGFDPIGRMRKSR